MSELIHLLTNPAHWAFEGVTDLVYGGIGALVGAVWVRRHDRKHHARHDHTAIYTEIEELRMRVWSLERHTH
jgi:hypothetical protein